MRFFSSLHKATWLSFLGLSLLLVASCTARTHQPADGFRSSAECTSMPEASLLRNQLSQIQAARSSKEIRVLIGVDPSEASSVVDALVSEGAKNPSIISDGNFIVVRANIDQLMPLVHLCGIQSFSPDEEDELY